MKKMIYLFLVLALCVAVLAGCGTNTPPEKETVPPQEQKIAWEDMERVDVYLPDFEDEWKADYKAFYEKYANKVLVVTGNAISNRLETATGKYLLVSQSGGGETGTVHMKFDEADKTEQVLSLGNDDNVVIEGVLIQPRTKNSPKPFNIELEHCKLLDSSAYVNPRVVNFDMTPAFEETKTAMMKKYAFVKNIEFDLKISDVLNAEEFKTSSITFDTEVADGTASKDVIAYANDAARLLNDNAHKLDESIDLSDDTYYGGLYKYTSMLIKIYPEGMKGQKDRYYVYDVLSSRKEKVIKLEKTYQ